MTQEGDLLWTCPAPRRAALHITRFLDWLAARGQHFPDYAALHRWSVQDVQGFWAAIATYFDIIHDGSLTPISDDAPMPHRRWLPEARLNYAEHVLRHETAGDPARPMLHHGSEMRAMRTASWAEISGAVRKLATKLRAMGLGPGDAVVAYMPNLPETVIAMLATAAIGAVWSSAAPEFGPQTVIDRFGQIAPKLVFAVNGYRYGGKDYDRSGDLGRILAALPSVTQLVLLEYLPDAPAPDTALPIARWPDMLAGPEVTRADFRFARMGCDHPLWVLFTSGTTGLPKAIVHNHHGIVLEHYKSAAFHFEIAAGGALFFYSTTGWMVWNTLMWGPLMNGRAVLFDGHPSHGGAGLLWRIAAQTGTSVLGISPTYIQLVRAQGIVPKAEYDLGALQSVMLVGSPSTPETFHWVHDAVKSDIWASSQSGGTEFCAGLLAGSPLLATRAGEIGAAALGVDARALHDDGTRARAGDEGELAIAAPMPSMPLRLWGDSDYSRYRAAYFDAWPQLQPPVWRHGDRVRFTASGGAAVLGRSDATLNRFGVRIGSAEIYRTIEGIAAIADSVVLCIEDGAGGYWMPLFVQLAKGAVLNQALRAEITQRLRTERSPRHVPDEVIAVPEIPLTLTGKKMEVPLRKLMLGAKLDQAASLDATRNPAALQWFAAFAAARRADATAPQDAQVGASPDGAAAP